MISLLVGASLGFLSGLGVGGGSLLILWLTLVQGMEPQAARSINLLFFIPCALIAAMIRIKQGSVPFRKILPAILGGAVAALCFSLLSTTINTDLLKKCFGILLIATGFREILYKPQK